MAVELIFTKFPIETGNTVYCITTQNAVNELKAIFKESKLENCILDIPLKIDSNFPQKIQDKELNLFFENNAGSKIIVLPTLNGKSKNLTIASNIA